MSASTFIKKVRKYNSLMKAMSEYRIKGRNRRINKFSTTFFSKCIEQQSIMIDENSLGVANPHDSMEHVCDGISRVYKGGTFFLFNQYPMMNVKRREIRDAMMQRMNITFMSSRKRKVL